MAAGRTIGKAYIEIVGDVSNFEAGLRRQLTRVFLGISGLAIAGAAAGKLFGLAGSLEQVAGAAFAVPGALAVASASIAGLVVAVGGLGAAFKDAFTGNAPQFQKALEQLSPLGRQLALEFQKLVPQLKSIKFAAQDAFAGELVGNVTKLVNTLQGPLKTGLAQVSQQWGILLAAEFATIQGARNVSTISEVFAATARSFEGVRQGIVAVTQGFLDLVHVGLPSVVSMSDALGKAGEKFGAFLTRTSESGRAVEALQAANVVLAQLGRILVNVLIVLGDVFKVAASSQSGGLLKGLDAGLVTLKEFVRSADGVRTLTNLFNALGAIAAGLAPIFVDLLKVIGVAFGPQLLPAIEASVGALASLVEGLGPAIAAFTPAFAAFFEGVAAGFAALGPFLPTIGKAFGQILEALAPLLPIIVPLIVPFVLLALSLTKITKLIELFAGLGPVLIPFLLTLLTPLDMLFKVLGQIFQALSPVIDAFGVVLKPIIATLGAVFAVLGDVLGEILKQLAPIAATLITTLAGALKPILDVLPGILKQLLEAFLPLVPAILALVPAVVQIVVALTPLIQLAAALLVAFTPLIALVIQAVAAFVSFATQAAIAPLLTLIAEGLTAILSPLQLLIPPLTEFGKWLSSIDWKKTGDAIGHGFVVAWDAVKDFFVGIGRFLGSLPGKLGDFLASLPEKFVELIKKMFDAGLQAIGIGIGLLIFAVTELPGLVLDSLIDLVTSLPKFFSDLWQTITDGFWSFVFGLGDAIVTFGPMVLDWLTSVGTTISDWWTSFWDGFGDKAKEVLDAVVGFIVSIPDRIAALPGQLLEFGKNLWNSFVDGLESVLGRVGGIGGTIVEAIKSGLNHVIDQINEGIAKVDDVLPGNLPRLPRLAEGMIVRRPTLAVVGEDGAEAVIPLTKPRRAAALLAEAGLAGGGAPTIVAHVYVGDREITDIVKVEVDQQFGEFGDDLARGPRAA